MNQISEIHEADIARAAHRKLPVAKMIERVRSLEYHGLKEHIHFIVAAVIRPNAFLKLTLHDGGEAFERLIADRPQYVSLLTSPYIDARWSGAERVDRLIEHASALRGQLRKYDFPVSQSLHLVDLAQLSIPNYSIVIDKPIWFLHEGLITLNLFKDNFRFFSITFSFCSGDRGRCIIIGGIQGRRTADILAQYREFTKIALGLRPRDFLFEVLRIIARAENVKHIFGIPDRFRYHRQAYSARDDHSNLHLDYDEIWQDRGGALNDHGMYEIPLIAERQLDRIAAKKRSIYRRRYDLLATLETTLVAALRTAVPIACGQAD